MSSRLEHLGLAAIAAALGLVTVPAAADVTKSQCVAANVTGQYLRRAGKLAEAREQFKLCRDPSCPRVVREDCTARLDEAETAQPTIIFDVHDASGHDLTSVLVELDGHPWADKIAGRALQLDPGVHRFELIAPGRRPVAEEMVVKEGEKERHAHILFGPTQAAQHEEELEAEPAESAGGLGPQKVVGVLTMGAGGLAIAVGSVYAVLTLSAIAQQRAECPTSQVCPDRSQAAVEHSTWTSDSTVATASFVAAGALLAGGAFVFLTAPAAHRPRTRSGLSWTPSVGPRGGEILLRGDF
jgi:hypothetical protein